MNAINDKSYPERDEYFSDMKPENVSARESFSYQMNELLKSQKDDYDRQKEKEEILQLFQLASSDKNYIVKDSRLKGSITIKGFTASLRQTSMIFKVLCPR